MGASQSALNDIITYTSLILIIEQAKESNLDIEDPEVVRHLTLDWLTLLSKMPKSK